MTLPLDQLVARESNTTEKEQGSIVDKVEDQSKVKDVDCLVDSIMKVTVSSKEESSSVDGGAEEDNDDSWITPENIEKVCNELGGMEESPAGVSVCCVTADYAMQVSY